MTTAYSYDSIFAGPGEVKALMREMDWRANELGPPEQWPRSLRTAAAICLSSAYPMFIWWGPQLLYIYNDAYRPIFGDKHPRFIGRPAFEAWPEIWDDIGPLATQVMETGEPVYFDDLQLFMERRGYPEEVHFTFSYSPLPGDDGSVAGVFCACIEITQRVLVERRLLALRELGTQATSVEDALKSAAAVLERYPADIPLLYVYAVSADTEGSPLVGFGSATPEQATEIRTRIRKDLGNTGALIDIPPGIVSGPWPEPVQKAFVVPIPRADLQAPSEIAVFGVSPRLGFDDDYKAFFTLLAAKIGGMIDTARSYESERKRAESLAELDRAKTAFFSNVSHEFRTPLTLMLGPLEELLASGKLDASSREHAATAHRNSLRLLRLVNTLLDFSRIEAGRIEAVYEPVDIARMTEDLASVFRSAIERAGLRLIVACDEPARPVYVDRDMWEKIVLNLLSNALKFTFEGEIAVALKELDGDIELSVRDTGMGIGPAELPRIFERFHRVRDARSRTHEGSGIGLALVHELARLHGGSVSVESQRGAGSTFRVRIPTGTAHLPAEKIGGPRALEATSVGATPFVEEALRWVEEPLMERASTAADDALTSSPRVSPNADRAATVLVVDDNHDMRDYVSRLLRQHWNVVAVSDGMAALEQIGSRDVDLVVADIMMPVMDGLALLSEIRRRPEHAQLPVILLSARAGEEARIEGLQAGADDYLVKPFSGRELLARVASQLELAALRGESRSARRELERALAAKDEFLSLVSHELRTPLTTILGNAVILAREGGRLSGAVRDSSLRDIANEAERLGTIIDDMLALARIESGHTLELEPVSVARCVEQCVRTLKKHRPGRNVQINVAADVGFVEANPDYMAQVLGNLLSNAAKYSAPDTTIEVDAVNRDGLVAICVKDRGRGIEGSEVEQIFSPFVRGTGAESEQGLGVGLTVCKRVIEAMRGTIAALPRDGGGSVFEVVLPAVTAE